jgi:hypothetical protein
VTETQGFATFGAENSGLDGQNQSFQTQSAGLSVRNTLIRIRSIEMPSGDFPDDENGDALRNMKESGDDLSKSRTIDFSVLFKSLDSAQRFLEVVKTINMDAFIEEDSPSLGSVDVTVKRDMIPTHKHIGDFEATLEGLAGPFGGANDGWGSFSQQVRFGNLGNG